METTHYRSSTGALLFLLMLALLAGCGPTVTARSNSSSTLPITYNYGNLPSISTGSTGTHCNMFDSRDIRLTGKVTSYAYNGVLQEDKVRLRITALSDRFDSSSNVVLKMFRWKASSAGVVDLDQTPVDFVIEKGTQNSFAISSAMNSLNVTTVTNLRGANGITGTTTSEFFNQTVFVVSGVDYNWDVLKIVLYDGANAIGSADVLLPVFAANPNSYALDHAGVLQQLHPFYSQRTQSQTDAQWAQRAQGFCF